MAGNGLSERLQTPISTAELERRWKAVRAAMKREGVDVLLMQNNNDHMGGYVKYFTDMPATNGYPNTVIFPADDEMTVVCQGPFNGDRVRQAMEAIGFRVEDRRVPLDVTVVDRCERPSPN